jgi:hypothetical protein
MVSITDLCILPGWVLACLERPEKPATASVRADYTPSGSKWLADAMWRTGDGRGDAVGFWLACQLLIDAYNGAQVDVYAILREYAALATRNPRDPFDEKTVARWVRSAGRSRLVTCAELARSRVA